MPLVIRYGKMNVVTMFVEGLVGLTIFIGILLVIVGFPVIATALEFGLLVGVVWGVTTEV